MLAMARAQAEVDPYGLEGGGAGGPRKAGGGRCGCGDSVPAGTNAADDNVRRPIDVAWDARAVFVPMARAIRT